MNYLIERPFFEFHPTNNLQRVQSFDSLLPDKLNTKPLRSRLPMDVNGTACLLHPQSTSVSLSVSPSTSTYVKSMFVELFALEQIRLSIASAMIPFGEGPFGVSIERIACFRWKLLC